MPTKGKILEYLEKVIDPEMYINIVELGLVYRVDVAENRIEVDITLTYPGCPLGPQIQDDIVETLKINTGIEDIQTKLVWQPLWQPEFMSEEARVGLGYPI
jgi:metal-sulfur cluster biosynthetic enzyme